MNGKVQTITPWIQLQQQDNKNGVPAKVYYKATKNGIIPYKYVRNENGNKTIILIDKEATE